MKQNSSRYFLAADQDTHPAWTGKKAASIATGQAAKFKKRFDFLSAKKTPPQ